MTNEELDRLWFEAMHQSIEANENFVRYRFAALVAAAEKQKVVEYMNSRAFATGHGDTIDDLLKELEWQVAEREREACAKVAESFDPNMRWSNYGVHIANTIRARGET